MHPLLFSCVQLCCDVLTTALTSSCSQSHFSQIFASSSSFATSSLPLPLDRKPSQLFPTSHHRTFQHQTRPRTLHHHLEFPTSSRRWTTMRTCRVRRKCRCQRGDSKLPVGRRRVDWRSSRWVHRSPLRGSDAAFG